MLAAEWECEVDLVDYLLDKGMSPIETDLDRWYVPRNDTFIQPTLMMRQLEYIPYSLLCWAQQTSPAFASETTFANCHSVTRSAL
jgi:hypothetical protein